MKFRYETSGQWFKGNTHIHSIASDGGKDFSQLAELYSSAGYDFLFRTDHWIASDESKDTESFPLLWIDGTELDGHDEEGSYYHIVCLGKIKDLSKDDGFMTALKSARQQGALAILAHPQWCGNSLDDVLRHRFDGVEVYNHVCHWLNGKSNGATHWDAALRDDPMILGLASDDAHLRPEHPGWNGGWIVANAPLCTAEEILGAIGKGNFYSSCGPEIQSISFDGEQLLVDTSPIRFARLVGPGPLGQRLGAFEGDLLEKISFTVPLDWEYCYLEIEDKDGKRAWTNSLFIKD